MPQSYSVLDKLYVELDSVTCKKVEKIWSGLLACRPKPRGEGWKLLQPRYALLSQDNFQQSSVLLM